VSWLRSTRNSYTAIEPSINVLCIPIVKSEKLYEIVPDDRTDEELFNSEDML